jgi:hypothetical protein
MRQLIAAVVLVAFLALPTAWFLGAFSQPESIPEPPPVEVKTDAAAVIVEGMQEIALGLKESLDVSAGHSAPIALSAPPSAAVGKAPAVWLTPTGDDGTQGLFAKLAPVDSSGFREKSKSSRDDANLAIADEEGEVPVSSVTLRPMDINDVVLRVATAVPFRQYRFEGSAFGLHATVLIRNHPTGFTWFDIA